MELALAFIGVPVVTFVVLARPSEWQACAHRLPGHIGAWSVVLGIANGQ